MKKKLTFSSGSPVAFCLVAFLLSLMASFSELVGRKIYNAFVGGDLNYILSNSTYSYIKNYGVALTMLIVSFVFFGVIMLSRKKKAIGAYEIIMTLALALMLTLTKGLSLFEDFRSGILFTYAGLGNDELFIRTFTQTVDTVIVFGGLFLFFSSFVLLGRLLAEDFSVSVERKKPIQFEVSLNKDNPVVIDTIQEVNQDSIKEPVETVSVDEELIDNQITIDEIDASTNKGTAI